MHLLLMLWLALVIDLTLGEPPAVVHPVVWMGKIVSFLVKGVTKHSSVTHLLLGLGIVLATLVIFVVPAYFFLSYLESLSLVAYVVVAAVILKTTFSLKELRRAALRVRNLLVEDKLAGARFELRSLVGRDTKELDKRQMVSATIESVAENSCDSFVAPLFYFLLFGIPGAVAYRVINTLDAMIGHHGEFEYLGKFAARLDDVANFIPARITVLLIALAALVCKKDASGAWRIMRRDRGKTESPNAGWSMATAAGAMNVQVEKIGHYRLGEAYALPAPESIDASLRLVQIAMLIWTSICLGVIGLAAT